MDKIIRGLMRISPETLEQAKLRYHLLRAIAYQQPVGRRQLAFSLNVTERTARSELDWLKERGALFSTPGGLMLTPEGEELLRECDAIIPYLEDLDWLSEALKRRFDLQDVVVVPGDSWVDRFTKKDLGRAGASCLKKYLFDGCKVAVTGGTTLREVAEAMTTDDRVKTKVAMVLPARGGVGQEVEEQANTIAAHIARTLGSDYRFLHLPDHLEEESVRQLREDPHISELLREISLSDIVVFGIGSAMEMATRRGIEKEGLAWLEERRAVGEAFRYFFNAAGEVVYHLPGLGLTIDDLGHIKTRIAVAGGSNKGPAIRAVLTGIPSVVLVTDEGAARTILENEG